MASEHSLWKKVRKLLEGLDPHRVENRVEEGMPDVNCTLGWIELKHFDKWNKNDEVDLDEIPFSNNQRIWLRRRCLAGGGAFLLLRVGGAIFLFDGQTAFNLPRKLHKDDAVGKCLNYWAQHLMRGRDLQKCLKYRI